MNPEMLHLARLSINQAYLTDETTLVHDLLMQLSDYHAADVSTSAHRLVTQVRNHKDRQSIAEAFLHEYQLNSDEGIVLMSIAEALLRIPDQATQDRFPDWHQHYL